MGIRSALSLGLFASVGHSPAIAAPPRRLAFDIAAAPASVALATFSTMTGIAIGWPSGLPPIRLRSVRGTMTVDRALRRLLEGSGFEAVQAGQTAYRIVRRRPEPLRRFASADHPRVAPPTPALTATPTGDIIVTGQKQPQALRDVPMSLAILDLKGVETGRLSSGTRDIVSSLEGVAITNLGPGRNRQFIRGVADSPFNGPSQSTVAVQLDEARVTFDAPDPDIRVVDMTRIEVLKGPQGPLYGSGALGGIYHIVTNKPELDRASGAIRLGAESVAHGGLGAGLDAVINLPIKADTLAIRGVGYFVHEGGWIDNVGRRDNANSTKVGGARLAVRWQPDADWTVDIAGILQDVNTRDSQYVTASDDTIDRTGSIAEPTDNDFKEASATVRGKLGSLDLLATSSYVRHQVDAIFDASLSAPAFGLSGPASFTDDRKFEIRNHEVRVSSTTEIRWLAGLSYMDASSRSLGTIQGGAVSQDVETLNRKVREAAAFSEVTIPLADRFKTTIGARLFHSQAEDETFEQAGGSADRISKTILSPSVAVSWAPAARALVYLRYARAVRPGGLALVGGSQVAARRFDSDELGTFDLGVRLGDPAGRLSLNAAAFATDWQHIQSDYLLASGLVSTRNAGRGRIYGAEASADWRPADAISLGVGATYVDARLIRDDTGDELDDRRLPVTPDLTLRGVAQYRFALGGWSTTSSAQVNYVGRARLSFDPDLDRAMGDYATVGLSALASRSRITLGLRVDNLFDVKGDSFAFGNPFSIRTIPQYTPLRPRTVSVSLGRRW